VLGVSLLIEGGGAWRRHSHGKVKNRVDLQSCAPPPTCPLPPPNLPPPAFLFLHQFELGAGQGAVLVRARAGAGGGSSVAGPASNPLTLWYAPPNVTDVRPAVGSAEGGSVITITGSSLGVDLAAMWGQPEGMPAPLACVPVNRVLLGGVECDVVQVRTRL
jgi:hypothetical protein